MMRSISSLFDSLCKSLFYLGGLLLFLAAFITSYDVIMRYFFIKPTSWANDFIEYSLLYSTFLAAAWLSKTDSHIRLTVIYDMLSHRTKLIMDIISSLISVAVISCLLWAGTTGTFNAFIRGALIVRPITVPKWIIMIAIPIGFLLLLIVLLRNTMMFVRRFRELNSPDAPQEV